MGKKSLVPITESMYYVLLCLHDRNMYGTEIAGLVRKLTGDRVKLGPGTLYAILSTFETEAVIRRDKQSGRRITYAITEKGERLYQEELLRLRQCLQDSEKELGELIEAADADEEK